MTRRLVVTGASTGFGRDIARLAHAQGWEVLGTVRKDADAAALEAEGLRPARLDLTRPETIASGCAEILAWCGGRLDAVVHNAGSSWPGPIELMDLTDLRTQLEVNVVGHVDVTQRLLPAVREAKGRMVYISSESASVVAPLMGAYSASKRALEGIAEALAQETADQGVTVVVVAPGPYATAIWDTSVPRGDAYLQGDDPRLARYQGLARALVNAMNKRPMHDPKDLAALVVHTLDAPRPAFRYVAPFASRVQNAVRAALPTRWWHTLFLSEVQRRGATPPGPR